MLELKVKERKILGKKVKTLRQKGVIPAIVYGAGIESMPVELDYNDLKKIYKEAGKSSVVKLKIGDKEKNVLIHEIKKDPVTDNFIHVDFLQIKMDEKITAEVPLVFEGKSDAVEIEKGILNKSMTTLNVEALPDDLPHEIRVDLTMLKTFEDSIQIKDLKISAKVSILAEADEVVAAVIHPRQEQEEDKKEEEEEEAESGEKESATSSNNNQEHSSESEGSDEGKSEK